MSESRQLSGIDLRDDAGAHWVVKDEVVTVEFALAQGVLESTVGTNRYAPGDALLTGSTGDRWCVSRDRFDAKYRPEGAIQAGEAGRYRNAPQCIRGKQMAVAFSIARSTGGDVLRGAAGDWLVQYAPGDYGVVVRGRFEAIYRVEKARAVE
jgi:hypothetical protein